MNAPALIDTFDRRLSYLRISITDRCNLRCLYCVPDGRLPKLDHEDILTYEELLRLVRICTQMGVTKVRITGGEPLVRKGVYTFLSQLSAIPDLQDLSVTTNGVLLGPNLERLREAGVRRINVSLDTLRRERYREISGYDHFDRVWAGIEKALLLGFHPIKINVVALRGINEDELLEMGRLTFDYPFHVRFIEYMPIGNARMDPAANLLTPEIQERLSVLGDLKAVGRQVNDGPAQRYRIEGAIGELGFISSVSRHFCNRCNRLRLTASGQLRGCLLSDQQTDLRTPLRSGASDAMLANLIREAVRTKKAHHRLAVPTAPKVSDPMSGIGG
ncbi:MAG: GTP 3',8-cyclase MoaA [Desulfosarcinaceae bacterium]|nr:GTP 3',8-cyclase MoaA [Desulfosarcinaceae bacterium]